MKVLTERLPMEEREAISTLEIYDVETGERKALCELDALSREALIENRYAKYRKIGLA